MVLAIIVAFLVPTVLSNTIELPPDRIKFGTRIKQAKSLCTDFANCQFGYTFGSAFRDAESREKLDKQSFLTNRIRDQALLSAGKTVSVEASAAPVQISDQEHRLVNQEIQRIKESQQEIRRSQKRQMEIQRKLESQQEFQRSQESQREIQRKMEIQQELQKNQESQQVLQRSQESQMEVKKIQESQQELQKIQESQQELQRSQESQQVLQKIQESQQETRGNQLQDEFGSVNSVIRLKGKLRTSQPTVERKVDRSEEVSSKINDLRKSTQDATKARNRNSSKRREKIRNRQTLAGRNNSASKEKSDVGNKHRNSVVNRLPTATATSTVTPTANDVAGATTIGQRRTEAGSDESTNDNLVSNVTPVLEEGLVRLNQDSNTRFSSREAFIRQRKPTDTGHINSLKRKNVSESDSFPSNEIPAGGGSEAGTVASDRCPVSLEDCVEACIPLEDVYVYSLCVVECGKRCT